MDYIVSSGQVSNGLVISEGDSLEVNGGVVNDTIMNEGDASVYDGGEANATIVNGHFDEDREDWFCGRLNVSAGGVANDTKLNGGDLYVSGGGTANDTAVNAGGYFGVYDGGETNRAVVNAKGAFYVEDGGVANDTVVSGYYDEEYGDWERGGVYVEGGGTANTISVNAGGELYVEYGGSAGDVTISAGGILDGFGWSEDRHFDSIEDGIVQVADGVSIEDRDMTVSSGGVANDTTVYGYDYYEDGYRGHLYIEDGGVANNTALAGGCLYVEDGGVANDTTLLGGYHWDEYDDAMTVSSGGVANGITVNGGQVYIKDGGVANAITVNAGGCLYGYGEATEVTENGGYVDDEDLDVTFVANTFSDVVLEGASATVHSGTIANSTVLTLGRDYEGEVCGGRLYVYDGGIANGTVVSGGYEVEVDEDGYYGEGYSWTGKLRVYSGGVANDTTVTGGYRWSEEYAMTVYEGGVANGTTLDGGYLLVEDEGTVNDTTVNAGGEVYVENGGVANAITVNAGGCLYGYGEATEVTENGGYVDDELEVTFVANTFSDVVLEGTKATVHSGTIANGTILDRGSGVGEEDGIRGGRLYVYDGGIANGTVVSGGYEERFDEDDDYHYKDWWSGELRVYSGGVANGTTLSGAFGNAEEGEGVLYVEDGGVANDTTVNAGGYMEVDGVANTITVNAGGKLYCWGEATDVTENGGYVKCYGDVTFTANTFSDVVLAGTAATVHSGTIANNTTVCGLYDAEEDYWEEYGELYVFDGGVASNTTVDAGGELHVDEGGKLTGTLTIAEDAYVYMDPYSFLDFDISVVSPDNAALLNDWSLLGSTPEYTITTSMTQAAGVYALAGGAEDFYDCITVNTTDGTELGELEVDGDELITEKYIYALGIAEGTLSLTVRFTDTEPPVKPTAAADITTATNKDITITATFSDDSVVKEYSLDGETWSAYTTGTVFKENGTIYFRAADEAGNVSEVTEFVISNIDRIPPAKPTATADVTAPTNQCITVTAAFSEDSTVKQYSLDNLTWQTYTAGVTVCENGTVYFRAADEAGNVSEVTEYEVANIDTVAPDAPVAAANITAKTTGKVTVTATFSADSAQKQYSTDQKTWQAYTSGVVFTENGTVYFRGTDEAGNISDVTSYTVSNIIADTFTTESTVAPGAEAAFTPKLEAAGLYTVNGTFKGAKGSVTVVDKTGKKVGSGSVKNGFITFKNALLLDNSNTYKVVVKNTDKKGGTSAYTVELKAKELFLKGDTTDNTLKGARTLAAGTTANDWVGYGDAVDYYKLGVAAAGGIYDLSLSGVKNNVKLTVYSKSGAKVKTVTASAAKPNIPLAGLCLDSGSYAVIEAPKAAKAQNSDYALKLTEKATFNWKNNDWNGATVLTTADAPFAGALTKAAGGDVVDYCDVSALSNLSFKTTAGKVKVSFYDKNKQAVKVAIKAGGKDKTAAAVSLTSGKTDNFTIGTLPGSVKYLKIEASGKTLNSYSIGKLA